MSNTQTQTSNPFDLFIIGCRKGWGIVANSLIPNVLMAFVLTYILQLLGILDFMKANCGFLVSIFGLPGTAIAVLLATWLSCGAGVGVCASLMSSGQLTPEHATILAPAMILMASQIQYMGRLLGVTDCPKKYWPLLMFNSLLMAGLGMLVMRFVAMPLWA
ncbi:MAG: hypothetical protein HUK26_00795 [Duodenibacillus sp.]|nr:hypothetical protein [Duodenibacillus sp.]